MGVVYLLSCDSKQKSIVYFINVLESIIIVPPSIFLSLSLPSIPLPSLTVPPLCPSFFHSPSFSLPPCPSLPLTFVPPLSISLSASFRSPSSFSPFSPPSLFIYIFLSLSLPFLPLSSLSLPLHLSSLSLSPFVLLSPSVPLSPSLVG